MLDAYDLRINIYFKPNRYLYNKNTHSRIYRLIYSSLLDHLGHFYKLWVYEQLPNKSLQTRPNLPQQPLIRRIHLHLKLDRIADNRP